MENKIITDGESKENTREVDSPFKRGASSRANGAGQQASSEETALGLKLTALEETIQTLNGFVAKKNNVHAEIKRMITRTVAEIAVVMAEFKKTETRLEKAEVLTVAKRAPTFKRVNTGSETPKSTPLASPWTLVEKRKRSVDEGKGRASKTRRSDGQEATPRAAPRREKKVQRTSKRMTARHRADAIVVETVGAATYADILRKVKEDPSLKELEDKVVRVKRNQKGQMMFELKKEEGAKRDALKAAVTQALGEAATVTVRTQEISIVCRDMDEVTTKEEVLEALKKQLDINSLPESAIRSMRAAYGGTQTAVISLPFEHAKKILAVGKVKIGWTYCRVREATKPKSCFRCFDYGHLAKDCKGEDRSKLCRKCGEGGHIAKNCDKEPSCMICSTKDKKAPHITGSSKCPKFRSSMKTDKT